MGSCMVLSALKVPRKKVKWGDQDAPLVVTRIQVKGKRYDA